MKKLSIIIASIVCYKLMGKPKSQVPAKVVNNYFIKRGCSGNCHCKH